MAKHTSKTLRCEHRKYVWSFLNIMRERVNFEEFRENIWDRFRFSLKILGVAYNVP